ncbi:MAG: endonuclease III [Candidatus Omnitrophica bacterium]|jgi:endonuclease-3|nr:endonuclease III [Candidatus Omnitrophota bacterium]MDD5661526.1 endonuclease III [Candidatus Omnitrophota bacterium]
MLLKTIRLIEKQTKNYIVPSVTKISEKHDPYRVLISCILSLRTKDKITIDASLRLFQVADNPESMLKLSLVKIQKLIYPVGFYRNKSRQILDASRRLIKDYSAKVPASLDALLDLKGVGRKTANLVLSLGFRIPAICVDTHVHRISNRLGWVNTRNPKETEFALEKILPKNEWIDINTTLVTFGQNLCLPVSPFCSRCNVAKICKRIGVDKSR